MLDRWSQPKKRRFIATSTMREQIVMSVVYIKTNMMDG